MSTRDDLIKALNGDEPDTTPLSAYTFLLSEADAAPLLDKGLVLTPHVEMVKIADRGVEKQTFERRENGHVRVRQRLSTPVGTLEQEWTDNWRNEHLVKEPHDYRVLQWIVEHWDLQPNYEEFLAQEQQVGERGLVIGTAGRTPAQKINVDWAGTEKFCLDVGSEVTELFDLYEALKRQFIVMTRIIAGGPGRFVKLWENLTVSMLGPRRYNELLVPIYDICVPILENAGKRLMVHYDGALSAIRSEIAAAPFHMIESLTEPPEGNMTYDQCRTAWPDKVLWCNINVALYSLPPEQFRREVIGKRKRAGKRGVAFEISEDLPKNWRESIPVALEALRSCG